MKKSWIWIAAILIAAIGSARSYAEGAATPVAVETAEPQATDEKFFSFDESSGMITDYSDEGPKDVVIPETIRGVRVRSIGYEAFRNKSLTSLVLPEGLEEIRNSSFSNNKLKSLRLPSGLKSIATYAFSNNELVSVSLPEGLETLEDGVFIKNRLTTVSLPKSLHQLKDVVFSSNQLTSVQFSEGLRSIGIGCFAVNQLQTLQLPSSLEQIGISAFQENRLTEVRIPPSVTIIPKEAFRFNAVQKLTLHAGVSKIGRLAFDNNQLQTLQLPSGLKKIEELAFTNNPLPEALVPKGCSFHDNSFDWRTAVFLEYPKVQKSEAKLTVRFNKALKAVGAEDVALKLDGTKVEIRCEVQGERLIITPVGALEKGKVYRLYLYKSLQPIEGNGLKYPVTVFFKYLG